MKKAIVQYRFNGLIRLPEDESGAIPYFLADYVLKHAADAELVHVTEFTGTDGHVCDLTQTKQASYIDVILDVDEDLIGTGNQYRNEIDRTVAQKLQNCSFIVDNQVLCLNERFFVIEPYDRNVTLNDQNMEP